MLMVINEQFTKLMINHTSLNHQIPSSSTSGNDESFLCHDNL